VITFILYNLLSIYALWVFYLAVMNLQGSRDAGTLTPIAYKLGLPILYIGLALDFWVNTIPLTLIMLEWPKWGTKEFLVTARLTRLVHGPDCRKKTVALWYGYNLLDSFDPKGKHLR